MISVPLTMPTLSDEPGASLMRILTLSGGENDCFHARSLPQLRSQAFGGQVLAQAILAAAATLPVAAIEAASVPHSIHASFLRPADTHTPLKLAVERARDGRTLTSRRVDVSQDDLVFTAMVSFSRPREAARTYSDPMPDVPGPGALRDSIEVLQATGHPVGRYLGRTVAFSLRHVDGALYVSVPNPGSNTQAVWVRPRQHLPVSAPAAHAALLAYISDQIMLEPALRSLGVSWSHPDLRVATIDHGAWFHAPIDVNDWHLFVQDAPASRGGRSLTRASVYTRKGVLVASMTQEGMVALASGASERWKIKNRED